MDLKRISFCNKSQWNVCSNPFKKYLLETLEEQHQVSSINRSTRLYQPDKHSDIVTQKPYYISTKTIGNTYLLYCTKIKGVNQSFLIDRKVLKGYTFPRIILVRYRFDDNIYRNTLFEGDLVKTDSGWSYLVGDLLLLNGSDIRNKPLHKRLHALQYLLENNYQMDHIIEPCRLMVKKYFPFDKDGYDTWQQYQKSLPLKIQGMCLTSHSNYKPSLLVLLEPRNRTIPPVSKQSASVKSDTTRSELSTHFLNETQENQDTSTDIFTFLITQLDSSGIYQLWCNKAGNVVKHSIARVDGLVCLQFLKREVSLSKKTYIKCSYDFDFRKFVPRQSSSKQCLSNYNDIIEFTQEKCLT